MLPFGYWLEAFKKFATFSGRSRRSEYWSFALVNVIVLVAIYFVIGQGIVYYCFSAATLIPSIAVSIRRLHDSGRSGWYFLLWFIPLVNLIMIYFMLVDSQPGANEYGPNPKAA